MSERTLPNWAEELRASYLRGESSVFVLYGNVFDLILHEGKLTPLSDFVSDVLLKSKGMIVQYNLSTGIKIRKKEKEQKVEKLEELIKSSDPEKAVETLESLLLTQDRVGLVIDYADMLAPRGETTFLSEADRKAVTRLHRWSLDRRFDNADNIVVLIAEQLTDLNQKIVSNPKITSINVPLPDDETRRTLIRLLEPDAEEKSVARLADMSAGLKNVQVRGILAPGEDAEEEVSERRQFILRLLGDSPGARERADKLSRIFVGQTHDEIRGLLRPEGVPAPAPDQKDRWQDVITVLKKRKREILERECFGLIEFVEPAHDLSDVGGMEGVKRELMGIARNIRDGNTRRVPMGLLFTGPMGSGKTFVAEAFARSSGLTAIKLKNFRSKWVGSTEGNLEKILGVVKAIGNILVIVDEGDRAFGNTSSDGDGDGGTSSRVIARLKEFMSDTTNRGRVLFVMMTNRPDKLDADIKRAGRLDRKIPFFYAQDPDDVELVLEAQLRRQKVEHDLVFPRDRPKVSEKMLGYSNADIEAVTVLANDIAQNEGSRATAAVFERALGDYLPSRDVYMLEYMELLAVFESSSRQLLPKRYQQIELSELQERLAALERRFG